MRKKIVITGMGAITPIGNTVTEYWDNLIHGASGVTSITRFDASALAVKIAAQVKDFRGESYMPQDQLRQSDAFTQYAFAAAKQALQDELPAPPDRMGIVMGTAMAGIATTATTQDNLTKAVHKNVGPRFVPRILGNIAASQIAIQWGICGPSLTLSTACAAGGDAINTGAGLLLSEAADAVLVVGAESILCPLVIYSLANAQALSRKNDDPIGACRPFDQKRSGFVIGEGGGALVLETLDHAKARGATIYAELAGWANNNDAYHLTSPIPEGTRSAACMRQALKVADLSPDSIGYINAHGTGTIAGDRAEANAILQVFGEQTPYISSTKGATGHMMGAGGVVEAIACIQALNTGILPPNTNLDQPESSLNFVMNNNFRHSIRYAMSNAFGFGGQNSSLVFAKI